MGIHATTALQGNGSIVEAQESRRELIALLEFEIGRIEKEQQRPGWTKWALTGAAAGCVWLLLKQFDSQPNQMVWQNAAYLFLIWHLVWGALEQFRLWLSSQPASANSKAGFWFTNVVLSGVRLAFCAKFVERLFLLLIVFTSPFIPHNWVFYTAIFVFGGSGIATFAGVILTYWKFKLSNDRPKSILLSVSLSAVGAVPAALLLVQTIRIAHSNLHLFNLTELRVSLILFALAVIIPLILLDTAHYPFLVALSDLRRKLALQEISFDHAKQQADIFFKGMNAKQALQEDIDAVLTKYREAAAAAEILLSESTALASVKGQADTRQPELDFPTLSSLIPSKLKDIETLLKAADEARDGLKGLVWVLSWVTPSNNADMKTLLASVDASAIESTKETQRVTHEIKKLAL